MTRKIAKMEEKIQALENSLDLCRELDDAWRGSSLTDTQNFFEIYDDVFKVLQKAGLYSSATSSRNATLYPIITEMRIRKMI